MMNVRRIGRRRRRYGVFAIHLVSCNRSDHLQHGVLAASPVPITPRLQRYVTTGHDARG